MHNGKAFIRILLPLPSNRMVWTECKKIEMKKKVKCESMRKSILKRHHTWDVDARWVWDRLTAWQCQCGRKSSKKKAQQTRIKFEENMRLIMNTNTVRMKCVSHGTQVTHMLPSNIPFASACQKIMMKKSSYRQSRERERKKNDNMHERHTQQANVFDKRKTSSSF